jgi:predicted dehydrogenase
MKVLIFGLGSIGMKHVSVIQEIYPNTEFFAFRSNKTNNYYPGIMNINSLDEIISIDFIIISNPTSKHKETIENSLRFNCPIFIEKPISDNIINVESLVKKIYSKNIPTYVACNMRFHPALIFLKHYLEEGKFRINEVNIYSGSYLPDWRPLVDFRTVYSANRNLGGGVHLDLIHDIDYCIWIFGYPQNIHSVKTDLSSLKVEAVDYAQFSLTYSTFTANIILNYYRKDSKRQIEIVTETDTITIDLIKNTVYSYLSKDFLFEREFNIRETYIAQMEYFLRKIHLKEPLMNSIQEGFDILKIALHE